ncbi:MAG: hypothetical protein GKR94_11840 [Gammaproteobacteria bacterium]|nr:hypothetical protein [Gammaproteobacteria bacterium]
MDIRTEVTKDDAPTRSIKTQINLIDGDISNAFDEGFVTGDLTKLVDFHQTQVDKGQQIIKDNLEALKSLYELITANEKDLDS